MRKAITTISALALLVLALVPTASTTAAGAARPLRLTVGTVGPIGSLDPRGGDSVVAQEVWNLQYPTLTSLDPKTLDPIPGLASAWSPMANGRGWVYTLRRGLTWSDGKPVTADDVVYSLELARNPRAPLALRVLRSVTARALNARSVEMDSGPVAYGPSLPLHVVPKHVFETTDNVDADIPKLGVADGAWHVVARSADSVQLQATAATGGPTLFEIDFRTYPTTAALIDALVHKQVDVVSGVPAGEIGRLEALPNITVDHASDGTQYVLRDRLPDVRTRQAISLAIDRAALVTKVVRGVGTPGVAPLIARGAMWALDASTVESLTTALDAQPDRARELLARGPKVKRKVIVAIASHDATSSRIADYVREALTAIGLSTETGIEGLHAGRRTDVVIEHLSNIGDSGLSGLFYLRCPACPGLEVGAKRFSPPDDFAGQVSYAHSKLRDITAHATVVGLFEPDTLQAFRTDNVTGFLRDPEIPSLVVFGPTVTQYSQLAAAPPPPGEQLSNTAYAVGAVIVLVLCIAAFLFAALIRRRFVIKEGAT